MSTSLLYHGFGLVGYTYVRTVYEEGKVIFTVKHKGDKLHCPECGSRDLVLRGCTPRRFRMVPIGSKVTFLDLGIQRVALQTVRYDPPGRSRLCRSPLLLYPCL
jgi:DNA-directed RNA polymerase subunit RPC12/RpoP